MVRMNKLRGLYRYETAPDRWWACAEDENGQRVNMVRRNYEQRGIQPPFLDLPIQSNGSGKKTKVA